MRLYELLKQVSDILTPQSKDLYKYMLHTFDNNGGFLRTRYCYLDAQIPDRSIPDLEKVLICFRQPYIEGDPFYIHRQYGDALQTETLVKMQLFYSEGDMDGDIEWSRQLGYPIAYIIALTDRTYEVRHYESLC